MEDLLDSLLDSAPLQQFETQMLSASFAAPDARVSTMTAACALTQSVDLRVLAQYIPGGNVIHDPRSIALVTAQGARRRSFQNQASVELKLASGRRCCAAVFSNGKVKLTGCRSEAECHEAAGILVSKIRKTKGPTAFARAVPDPSTVAYHSMEMVMIKCDFDLDFTLDLHRVFALMRGQFDQVTFEPERYCAVKVSVPTPDGRGVTVCIFHTGKAFASGRNSVDEVTQAFGCISGTLLLHRDAVYAPIEAKGRKKRNQADQPVTDPPAKRAGGAEDLWAELLEASKVTSPSKAPVPIYVPVPLAAQPVWELSTQLSTQAA
mmetsp:Transcript_54577/g.128926  ORF Transcript_54577/g.128926 Transcript_54577/m.128926 type:complete len:321 (-) Transcript_54577:472-1434(-)